VILTLPTNMNRSKRDVTVILISQLNGLVYLIHHPKRFSREFGLETFYKNLDPVVELLRSLL
jgi:hypothetical protein